MSHAIVLSLVFHTKQVLKTSLVFNIITARKIIFYKIPKIYNTSMIFKRNNIGTICHLIESEQ